jgi:hypothetical protein
MDALRRSRLNIPILDSTPRHDMTTGTRDE